MKVVREGEPKETGGHYRGIFVQFQPASMNYRERGRYGKRAFRTRGGGGRKSYLGTGKKPHDTLRNGKNSP